jgi:hypothetical protein
MEVLENLLGPLADPRLLLMSGKDFQTSVGIGPTKGPRNLLVSLYESGLPDLAQSMRERYPIRIRSMAAATSAARKRTALPSLK